MTVTIDVREVSHTYDADTPQAQLALAEATFRLAEHRVGLIGHNGSGKSTFVRLVDGLIRPSQGTITVDGLDTVRDGARVRARTGFLFADPDDQIVMPTVREDVTYSLRRDKLGTDEVTARVDRYLAAFGLSDLGDRPAHLLSGGQKQLLALAAVLVREPALVLMDEPTTLLDLRGERWFAEQVTGLGQTVVLATHRLDLLTGFDRVLVFDHGRVVADDAPAPAIAWYRRRMDGPVGVEAL